MPHSEKCHCDIKILVNGILPDLSLGLLDNLCVDVILGGDFLQKHNRVIFRFNSEGCDLVILCGTK